MQARIFRLRPGLAGIRKISLPVVFNLTGLGMAVAALFQLFGPLYRVEGASTNRNNLDGSFYFNGLGLASGGAGPVDFLKSIYWDAFLLGSNLCFLFIAGLGLWGFLTFGLFRRLSWPKSVGLVIFLLAAAVLVPVFPSNVYGVINEYNVQARFVLAVLTVALLGQVALKGVVGKIVTLPECGGLAAISLISGWAVFSLDRDTSQNQILVDPFGVSHNLYSLYVDNNLFNVYFDPGFNYYLGFLILGWVATAAVVVFSRIRSRGGLIY